MLGSFPVKTAFKSARKGMGLINSKEFPKKRALSSLGVSRVARLIIQMESMFNVDRDKILGFSRYSKSDKKKIKIELDKYPR